MTPEEREEEGRIMDEILQRIDWAWDMSATPFSFYLHEKEPIRTERIAADREALARMLEGDPAEHRGGLMTAPKLEAPRQVYLLQRKPTRVAYRFDDQGKKVRICARTKVDL